MAKGDVLGNTTPSPLPGVCDPHVGNPGSATDFLLNINESTQKLLFQKSPDKLFLVPITPLNPGSGTSLPTHRSQYTTGTYKQLLGGTKTHRFYVLINTALCTQVSLDPTSVPVCQYISPGRFNA